MQNTLYIFILNKKKIKSTKDCKLIAESQNDLCKIDSSFENVREGSRQKSSLSWFTI